MGIASYLLWGGRCSAKWPITLSREGRKAGGKGRGKRKGIGGGREVKGSR